MIRPYRGKRIDNGKWVYGGYCEVDDAPHIIEPLAEFEWEHTGNGYVIGKMYEVDPATVGQSTGLKDKKRTEEFPEGQPIYEGDIIEWEDGDGSGYTRKFQEVVEFEQGAYQTMASQWGLSEFEVIGSVHDNPELIND